MPNRPTFRFCRIQVLGAYKHPKRTKRKENSQWLFLENEPAGALESGCVRGKNVRIRIN